jgi:hypothetical protein
MAPFRSNRYATYSSSIVISAFSNHYIVNNLLLTHRDAWIVTMLWTGVYNYFMLKKTWRPKVDGAASASTKAADIESGESLIESSRTR